MFLLHGIISVDSRQPHKTQKIDFRFNRKYWFSTIDEIYDLKKKIDEIYNPRNCSMDEAVLWALQNRPYGKNQIAARIIKIESPYDILSNVIDTDKEGFYEE